MQKRIKNNPPNGVEYLSSFLYLKEKGTPKTSNLFRIFLTALIKLI